MKNSLFIFPSLLLVLGIAVLLPQMSTRSSAATVPATPPSTVREVSGVMSAQVATESAPVSVETPKSVPSAPVLKTAQVEKQSIHKALVAEPVRAAVPLSHPVRLSIPAIALSAPIIGLATNAKGEMDVPDGKTNNVGWYEPGVIPGDVGTAVMDAHVFAAFDRLHETNVGDDIYVERGDGTHLHFVVKNMRTYALSELRSDLIFYETDGRHLNLVTCAGTPTPDGSTYTHRLVVYTELVP